MARYLVCMALAQTALYCIAALTAWDVAWSLTLDSWEIVERARLVVGTLGAAVAALYVDQLFRARPMPEGD